MSFRGCVWVILMKYSFYMKRKGEVRELSGRCLISEGRWMLVGFKRFRLRAMSILMTTAGRWGRIFNVDLIGPWLLMDGFIYSRMDLCGTWSENGRINLL